MLADSTGDGPKTVWDESAAGQSRLLVKAAESLPRELAAGEAPLPLAVEHRVTEYLRQSKSPRTWRAYESDWADFLGWCTEHRRRALPAGPKTVRGYLAAHAQTLATATLGRRTAAIAQIHEASGFDPPTRSLLVRELMKGILREKGRRPRREKKTSAGQGTHGHDRVLAGLRLGRP